MAETTVIHENGRDWGTRKYFTPASAPGWVTGVDGNDHRELTSSTGIINFETLRSTLRWCTHRKVMMPSDKRRTAGRDLRPADRWRWLRNTVRCQRVRYGW